MKRISLFILLVISAVCVCAQTISPVYQPDTDYVYRTGNTYVCNGQAMNKYQYRNFLATRYVPAYEQFRNGLIVSNVGWGLLGGGLALDIIGSSLLFAAKVQGADNNTSDIQQGLGTADGASMLTVFGSACCSLGGTLKIASIPTLCVGYSRMHRSADTYNVRHKAQAQLSVGVCTSPNSIGLALQF
mgnify:FL=1